MKSVTNSCINIIGDRHFRAFQVPQKNTLYAYAIVKIDKSDIQFIEYFDTKSQAKFYSYHLAPRRQFYLVEVNKWIPWMVS